MARMKALRTFTDISTGKLIDEGSNFECSDSAVKKLTFTGVAVVEVNRAKRKKADMLHEAETSLTNEELAEALDKADASPKRGRKGRPQI